MSDQLMIFYGDADSVAKYYNDWVDSSPEYVVTKTQLTSAVRPEDAEVIVTLAAFYIKKVIHSKNTESDEEVDRSKLSLSLGEIYECIQEEKNKGNKQLTLRGNQISTVSMKILHHEFNVGFDAYEGTPLTTISWEDETNTTKLSFDQVLDAADDLNEKGHRSATFTDKQISSEVLKEVREKTEWHVTCIPPVGQKRDTIIKLDWGYNDV